jgi:hypothetical protein
MTKALQEDTVIEDLDEGYSRFHVEQEEIYENVSLAVETNEDRGSPVLESVDDNQEGNSHFAKPSEQKHSIHNSVISDFKEQK